MNSAPFSSEPPLPLWATEVSQLKTAADRLEAEAQTWAEGFAVQNSDGSWKWESQYEWAHVRWHELRSSAQALRGMVARFTKKRPAFNPPVLPQ